jgi:hypothetical protein
LRKNNIKFLKEDLRENNGKLPGIPFIEPDIFSSVGHPVVLREYQVDAANLALMEQQGIIKCATGNFSYLSCNSFFSRN